MTHYSWFSVLSKALGGNKGWDRAWRDPEPKAAYDVIIVGGGGHGLATAYYLAKEHGITNVAVLEKGWLGGGNTGRNTTIIRSNYMIDGNTHFYEKSLQLWEGLVERPELQCDGLPPEDLQPVPFAVADGRLCQALQHHALLRH